MGPAAQGHNRQRCAQRRYEPRRVCRRYELSVEEFVTWQRAIETHGIAGLHVTRTQFYRGASRARPAYHSEATIQTGRLLVNLNTRVVSVEDQPVHLTGKQYRILELLSLGKGTTLTKEMFLDHLYGGMDEPEIRIIDVFVCKLRKKARPRNWRQTLHRDRVGTWLCIAGPSAHGSRESCSGSGRL